MLITIIQWTMTFVAVIGTICNSYRKRSGFIFWIISNIFWIIYDLYKKEYAQAGIFIFNTFMNIVGFFKWKRLEVKEEHKELN